MLYPQTGDRIVAVDSVTSLHPMHRKICSFSVIAMVVYEIILTELVQKKNYYLFRVTGSELKYHMSCMSRWRFLHSLNMT